MTGNELLRLQAVLHGLRHRRAVGRSAELLERVGLTGAADRRVGTYSGGMRRRLDLALALIHRPAVLFLDEPTTGLDPTSRAAVWEEVRALNDDGTCGQPSHTTPAGQWEEVRALNDDGTTVLLTTQYLEEADELAGRIAIIDGGEIVIEGDPTVLKSRVGDPTLRVEVADSLDHRVGAQDARCFRARATGASREGRDRAARRGAEVDRSGSSLG